MKLGVCYYPEHWPEEMWASDAERMKALGLSCVRIGEFAWSRIEPEPGRYDWSWLDRAVETLAAAGLEIIMGTPTATPPKWLVDAHPDILPHDEHGRPRRFGSRRHYSFSSQTYARESDRIVAAMAARYGAHPAVTMWQTDNEFGCHDTVESFDPGAVAAFRAWLAETYDDIAALNAAWGTAFWGQDYRSFDEVDPPAATVTEATPAHRLDWRRFSSDQVAAFNRAQVERIRAAAPGRDITHNFMGHFTAFDHFEVAKDLDLATWDSYPLGFLETAWWDGETKALYARQGHPDFAGFHHDLYRGLCGGRFGVMEQQPGPVNWAWYNPSPLPGMVRLWTLEAAAHGAELVSYFRWRQAPFGQERLHAGLNRSDNTPDLASGAVETVLKDLEALGPLGEARRGRAALIFDYGAQWVLDIQPQGGSFRYGELVFAFYSALRRLGLDIDILPPDADFADYCLIVAPSLPTLTEEMAAQLAASPAEIVIGPRTGSITAEFQTPDGLAPGPLQALMPIRVTRVESLRPGLTVDGRLGEKTFHAERWREFVDGGELKPLAVFEDAYGAIWRKGKVSYLACWPDQDFLCAILSDAAAWGGLEIQTLPRGVRLRRRGPWTFAFNYSRGPVDLLEAGVAPADADFQVGEAALPPAGVSVWRS